MKQYRRLMLRSTSIPEVAHSWTSTEPARNRVWLAPTTTIPAKRVVECGGFELRLEKNRRLRGGSHYAELGGRTRWTQGSTSRKSREGNRTKREAERWTLFAASAEMFLVPHSSGQEGWRPRLVSHAPPPLRPSRQADPRSSRGWGSCSDALVSQPQNGRRNQPAVAASGCRRAWYGETQL